MPKVSIKELTPSMVLAANVTNRNGVVLFTQGTEVSEKHIKTLKTWGVTHVDIEGEEDDTPLQDLIEQHPEYLQEAEQHSAYLFKNVDQSHPFFVELIEIWKGQYVLNKAKSS